VKTLSTNNINNFYVCHPLKQQKADLRFLFFLMPPTTPVLNVRILPVNATITLRSQQSRRCTA
jgi:hypothetical protein